MRHTEGPWHQAKRNKAIIMPEHGMDAICTVQSSSVPNWYKNAQLICASPELLLAAKTVKLMLEQYIKPGDNLDEVIKLLDRAIQKAEGHNAEAGRIAGQKEDV